MKQLLLECSEPGVVVALDEELEHILRKVDFKKAQELKQQLSDLSKKLGPEYEKLWNGFHLELSNDGCSSPPSFGKRERISKKKLQEFIYQAKREEIGSFDIYSTLLLPQKGPNPETREQYIKDLEESISYSTNYMVQLDRRPLDFPKKIEEYRLRLLKEYLDPITHHTASSPTTGHQWIEKIRDKLLKSLQEIDTKAVAIMEYELFHQDPGLLDFQEIVHWAVLSCSLNHEFKKWCPEALERVEYLYQRAALIVDIINPTRGMGAAALYLKEYFFELIEEAKSTYTEDGVQALELLFKNTFEHPWKSVLGLMEEEEDIS